MTNFDASTTNFRAKTGFDAKTNDFEAKTLHAVAMFIFMINLMYCVYLMSFMYDMHPMCWNYLVDLITHNRNRNSTNNSGD